MMFNLIPLFFSVVNLRKPKPFIFSQLDIESPVKFPMMNSSLHNGFVNSSNNEWGLQSKFYVGTNKNTICVWERTLDNYQGFIGIIHGGILTALADELMANSLVSQLKFFGVSLSSKFQWHKPLRIGEKVYGESKIMATFKNFVYVTVTLQNQESKVVLTGNGLYYLPTLKQFKKITSIDLPQEILTYIRN